MPVAPPPVQFLCLSSGWRCCFNPAAPPVHVLNVCYKWMSAFYKLQAMELITQSRVLQEAWVAAKKPIARSIICLQSKCVRFYIKFYFIDVNVHFCEWMHDTVCNDRVTSGLCSDCNLHVIVTCCNDNMPSLDHNFIL